MGRLGFAAALAAVACAAGAAGPAPRPANPPAVVIAPAHATPTPVRTRQQGACGTRTSFAHAWPDLQARLQTGVQGLADLIDPQHGVFVVDNPGATVVPMIFMSYAEAAERVPALRSDYYSFKCSDPFSAPTPSFSCETELWSHEGCVLTRSPRFSVAHWYDVAIEYGFMGDEAARDRERARQVDALIEYGVTTTEMPLGLYFAYRDCAWRLVAIDVITPCSA